MPSMIDDAQFLGGQADMVGASLPWSHRADEIRTQLGGRSEPGDRQAFLPWAVRASVHPSVQET
jgi:hypothetical protein